MKMTLRNFKGIRDLSIDLDKDLVQIVGHNEAGKSTIIDAWNWLLSGKDASGRADFDVKTRDKDGNYLHNLEHEVEAVINFNGFSQTFKRVLREKWVKKKGAIDAEFSGNETSFYIEDVPYSQSDYKREIEKLFGSEEQAKLLSNINHFNSKKWNEQREMLIALSDAVTESDVWEILSNDKDVSKEQLKSVQEQLVNGKTIELLKKQVSEKISKIKESLSLIPVRIDEATRSINNEIDFASVEAQISQKKSRIDELQNEVNNVMEIERQANQKRIDEMNAQTAKINELSQRKNDLAQKLNAAKRNRTSALESEILDIQAEINKNNSEYKLLGQRRSNIESDIKQNEEKIKAFNAERDELVKKWKELKAREFQGDSSIKDSCPTCARAYDADKVLEQTEAARAKFNTNKLEQLKEIETKGFEAKNEAAKLEKDISVQKENLQKVLELQDEFLKKNDILTLKVQSLQGKISNSEPSQEEIDLQKKIDEFVIPTLQLSSSEISNNSTLGINREAISQLNNEINILSQQLAQKDVNEKANQRIEQLLQEQISLNKEYHVQESMMFVIGKYTKAYIAKIEESVNSKFEYVKFRLFETQVNGAEVETCKCMVNGVNYHERNTASKINAGVDIIRTFAKHYGLYLPVFVDNNESVSEVLPYYGQLILLNFVRGEKLRVL